jgi:hypothetical protein
MGETEFTTLERLDQLPAYLTGIDQNPESWSDY